MGPEVSMVASLFACFGTYTLPEAEIVGIRSFFGDRFLEQHPRPSKGTRESNIVVFEKTNYQTLMLHSGPQGPLKDLDWGTNLET